MGWTLGLEPSTVGRSGQVRDIPWLPGILGWDGQWDCSHLEWDTWDVSGVSLGLWDGMDSGIADIRVGYVWDVHGTLGCGIAAI